MLIHRSLLLSLLLLPMLASANYETTRIKETLSKHQQAFQIQSWHTHPQTGQHTAISSLKGLSIVINKRQSVLSEPFVNSKMYGPAKKRCTHFGEIGLNVYSDTELLKVSETVAKATRRHALSHTEINGVRFEVLPKLEGAFVKLICRIKSAN